MNKINTRKKIIEDSYYYDQRWDLFSLVPAKSKNILDVGCGKGWLGAKIKQTRPCKITGIEYTDVGEYANLAYDKIYISDIKDVIPDLKEESFDCVILGDVLEHLINPWDILKKLKPLVSANGVFLISIPNIQHYTVLLNLIRGKFEYQKEGILDKTHLRFFTLQSFTETLNTLGLTSNIVRRNISSGKTSKVLNLLSANYLINFITFQFIFISKKI